MNEDSAHFQRQLQTLNEITIALSRLDSVDSLCWHAVKFGIERLDFDRIGIWFHDPARRMMVGSYGVDEDGTIRDERGDSWRYGGTYIDDFVAGKTEIAYPNINAPIYNDKSHVVGRGWHIAAPMRDGAQFIGVVTIDNLRYQRPMQPTQPELLRLYGITIGTLTTLARARASAFQLQIEQTRTGVLKQFITAIGHDFRTPLSIINTKAYLITRVQPEQHAPLVNDIQAQVKSIDAMLGRVLSYMTLTDGVMLTPMGNYLDTILTTLHTQFVPLAAAHQITLHLDALMPTAIFADAYYLSSALSEIIENAILYTPVGGSVHLQIVRSERDPHADPHHLREIGVRVRDSGIGIAAELHDAIFEPLYRVDKARTERRIGLGLTIAKTIITAHGGRITVQSAPDAGSTFTVWLPVG